MGKLSNGIRKQVHKKMESCAKEIVNEVYGVAQKELSGFYSQGSPNSYKRTKTLEGAARKTPVSVSGDSVEGKVYLAQDLSYSTGTFDGEDVLYAAEHNTFGVVGKGGFWERTDGKISGIMSSILGKYFS